MDFGNILKLAMEESNMSYADLAKILNVSDRTIYRWTNCTNEPDFKMICKICQTLNINLNQFMNLKNDEANYLVENKEELTLISHYRNLTQENKKLFIDGYEYLYKILSNN